MDVGTTVAKTALTIAALGLPFFAYVLSLRSARKTLVGVSRGLIAFGVALAGAVYAPQILLKVNVSSLAYSLPASLKILGLFAIGAVYGALTGCRSHRLHDVKTWLVWLPWFVLLVLIMWRSQLHIAAFGICWLLWVSYQIGAFLLPHRGTTPILVPVATGLAALMTLTFVLGVLGALVPAALHLTAIFLTIIFYRPMRLTFKRLYSLLNRAHSRGMAKGALEGFGLSLVLFGILAGTMPESGSDALGGRVALTKRFLEQGSITPFVDIAYSWGVVGGEALQCIFYLFAKEHVARLLAVACCALLFFSFSKWRVLAQLWIVPLLLSSLTLWQFVSGHVDLLQATFWTAAVLAALPLRKSDNWAIPGALAGAAAAVKLNGLAAGLSCALMLLFNRSPRRQLKALFTLALGSLTTLGPWLVRSYVATGNPLFPFAQSLFPGSIQHGLAFAIGSSSLQWNELLRIPYFLLAQPELFVEAGSFHPIVLLSVLLTVVAIQIRTIRPLGVASLVSWLFWLFSVRNLRYALAPSWLSTVTASHLSLSSHPQNGWRRGLLLLLALTVGVGGSLWDFSRLTGWFLRAPTGLAFPLERLLSGQSQRGFSRASVPSAVLGDVVAKSGHPWPQVCQVGLRDHLYVPGTQPTLWHSLEPLARMIHTLFTAKSTEEAQRAAAQLSCDWIMLNLGRAFSLPLEQRSGPYALEFWHSFGKLRGAVGSLILLEAKARGASSQGAFPESIRTYYFPTSLEKIQPAGNMDANPVPLVDGRSAPFSVAGAHLIGCTWKALAPSQGFVDLSVRDERQNLLVFFRQEFRMNVQESFFSVQSLPPGASQAQLSFHGNVTVFSVRCDLYGTD